MIEKFQPARNDDIETLNPRQDARPQAEKPLNLNDLAPLINSQFNGGDRRPQTPAPAGDTAKPAAPEAASNPKDVKLQYGDPKFDEKLAAGKIENLKLEGMPQGVSASPWLDNKGFYIWFINGNDNRTPHYLPPSLRTIEINGVKKDVDEMRVQAAQAYAMKYDTSKNTTRSLDGTETVFQFGRRMSTLSDANLQAEVNSLSAAAQNSNSPNVHLMYANFLTAMVTRPIVNNFNPSGNTFKIGKDVEDAVDKAATQAAIAARLAREQRNFHVQLQAERLSYMMDAAKDLLKLFPKDGVELPPIGNR